MEALIVVLRMILGCRRGQGMAEYALILALISIVAMVGLRFLGLNIFASIMNLWYQLFMFNLMH